MPKKKTTPEKKAVGIAFLKYLKETNQNDVLQKAGMGEIFRNSFKKGPGAAICKGCNFSSILYTLRMNGKVKIKDEQVCITSGFLARDQYSTLKKHALDLGQEVDGKARPNQHPYFCRDCNVQGNSLKSFYGHLKGKKHLQQMSLKYLKKNRTEFVQNRGGIEVSSIHDNEDGIIAFCTERNVETKFTIHVKNASKQEAHSFLGCFMLKIQPAINLQNVEDEMLLPGMECSVELAVQSNFIGVLQSPLLMAFKPANERTVFQILRFLKVEVQSDIASDLPPTIPYQRPTRETLKHSKGEIVDGYPLLTSKDSKLKMRDLKLYFVPSHLRYQVNSKGEMDEIEKLLEVPLSWDNYGRKLSNMLYIEECQMEVDIRRYDMKGATMKQSGRLFKLKVPGLAENRPSVLKGDHLFVRFMNDRSNPHEEKVKTYKGYVHHVELEEVALGFSQEFLDRYVEGMKVDIEFTFNRLPLRLQHFALEEALGNAALQNVLFPLPECQGNNPPLCPEIEESSLPGKLFDQKLASNTEQMRAIRHIVQGTSRPAPYLVFGPPGTGKTVTIVESIKQVYQILPQSRILACAPSNSAADLIAKRLVTGTGTPVGLSTLYRMNALSRDWKTVDPSLKECCNYNKMTGDNFFPPKEELLKKRILVTTLCTAGRFATAKEFPNDHFTHVFIDEAGHAIEPEAIISLANLLNPNNPLGGQVVLAGDPKQLGPIVRSPLAIKHGLEVSFLQRLMTKCKVYKRCNEEPHYDSKVLTKLLHNYRSHPAILKLPNQMFYANELKVFADKMARECLCQWKELPKKDFPLIFHGVEGVDEREGRSPSFFNKSEVEVVVEYTLALLDKRGGIRVKESDIGIISPYRRQVQKIKEVLRKRKKTDIKVGSVEEFQGQERMAIIVSTVRSTKPEHIQMDIDFNLGFVKNPKRLNVAVTRAKALLILVGNPYMLRRDSNWSMFLEYCLENKAYAGCDFTNEDDELEDVIQKFEKVQITPELVDVPVDERLGVSAITEQLDPEWRNEDC